MAQKSTIDAITAEILGEVMQDAWGEICSDTQCHPEDISRVKGVTFYAPRHWTDLIAIRLNERLAAGDADASPAYAVDEVMGVLRGTAS